MANTGLLRDIANVGVYNICAIKGDRTPYLKVTTHNGEYTIWDCRGKMKVDPFPRKFDQ